MRTIIVSSNERKPVKKALGEYLESDLPFDFLAYTQRGPIVAERKRFPGDFIASVQDGRFAKECAAMREASQWPHIIKEGRGTYTKDGYLRSGPRILNWTRKSVRNMVRSLELVEGCRVEETRSIRDTADRLHEIADYFDAQHHGSFRARTRLVSDWPAPTYQERYRYWLMGLPEISAVRADKLAAKFTCPMAICIASEESLMEVPGIGKYIAGRIYSFLHEER